MPALTYDHRSKHVTMEGKENGRGIPDPQLGGTPQLDPAIRFIDWDGVAGIVVYTTAERSRRNDLMYAALSRGKEPNPLDREIAETGEEKITNFGKYQFLFTEHGKIS